MLWPHARPWRLKAPEPALRCIPEAGRVADMLAGALRETHGQTEAGPAAAAMPRAEPRPSLVAAE